ncbi:hypothetical protein KC320_g214 [Hortaea werneckii]|nr:hypothetical protein KC320_g214 [Hortaea werneckii]
MTDHGALPATTRDPAVEKPVVSLKRRAKLVNLQSPRPTSLLPLEISWLGFHEGYKRSTKISQSLLAVRTPAGRSRRLLTRPEWPSGQQSKPRRLGAVLQLPTTTAVTTRNLRRTRAARGDHNWTRQA